MEGLGACYSVKKTGMMATNHVRAFLAHTIIASCENVPRRLYRHILNGSGYGQVCTCT